MRIVYSPRAIADLRAISAYLKPLSPQGAKQQCRYLARLHAGRMQRGDLLSPRSHCRLAALVLAVALGLGDAAFALPLQHHLSLELGHTGHQVEQEAANRRRRVYPRVDEVQRYDANSQAPLDPDAVGDPSIEASADQYVAVAAIVDRTLQFRPIPSRY